MEARKDWKTFGVGETPDDRRLNISKTSINRENVWTPYYEIKLEEVSMKDQFMKSRKARADEGQLNN